MSDIKTGSGAFWRAVSLISAGLLIALSAADSRAVSEFGSNSGGFLYSDYLQQPSLKSSDIGFSVSSSKTPFWRGAVLRAESAVSELPLTEYFAKEFINDDDSAVLRAGEYLESASWNFGADIIKNGVENAFTPTENQNGEYHRVFRRVNIDVETKTGRGFTHAGLDVIGAFRETESDAVAWQLRGYKAFEDDDKRHGINTGLAYRYGFADAMMGINNFIDYETYQRESFWRYSVGGEMRTAWLDFYGNFYNVLTNDTVRDNGLALYSADGYDFQFHLHSPKNPGISGILGYYSWKGKYGNDDENGLLAGVRLTPLKLPLLLELDYRSGDGENFGGNFGLFHQFGKKGSTASHVRSDGAFRPNDYFFEPVEREYTQRITEESVPVGSGINRVNNVIGVASVRGVEYGVRQGEVAVNLTTDLRMEGLSSLPNSSNARVRQEDGVQNSFLRLDGEYRGEETDELVVRLPWHFPPAATFTVNTQAQSTVDMTWNGGTGRRAVIQGNSEVMLGAEMMNVMSGGVSVSAESGFMFRDMNNVVVSLRGASDIQADASGIAVLGRFVMNVGGATYSNIGGDGEIFLGFNENSQITTSVIGQRVRRVSGGITVTLSPGALVVGVQRATGLGGGDGTSLPIIVSTGYSGVIATVVVLGGVGNYVYNTHSAGLLGLNSAGVITALRVLPEGSYGITVSVSRGERQVGAVTVSVMAVTGQTVIVMPGMTITMTPGMTMTMTPGTTMTVTPGVTMTMAAPGALNVVPVSGLTGGGTLSASPFLAPLSYQGVLATVSGAAGTDYSYTPAASGSLLTVDANGVVSAFEMLTTGSYNITVVATLEEGETAGMVTVYVSVPATGFEVAVSPGEGFSGSGSESSPYGITSAVFLDAGTTLAAFSPSGGLNYMYDITSPGAEAYLVNDDGELISRLRLVENLTLSFTVEIDGGVGMTLTQAVYFDLEISSADLDLQFIPGAQETDIDFLGNASFRYLISEGFGTADSPLLIPVDFEAPDPDVDRFGFSFLRAVFGRVATIGGSGGDELELSLTSGAPFQLDNSTELGMLPLILPEYDTPVPVGEHRLTVIGSLNNSPRATLVVHLSAFDLELGELSSTLLGDGSAGSPLRLSEASTVALLPGLTLATLSPRYGNFNYEFEVASGAGDLLDVNSDGEVLLDAFLGGSFETTLLVQVESNIVVTQTIHIDLEVTPATAATVFAERFSGSGSVDSPIMAPDGFDEMMATVIVVGGDANVDYTFVPSGENSLTVNMSGVVSASEALGAGDYMIEAVVMANTSPFATVTLHVMVEALGFTLSPLAGVSGDGTQGTPYLATLAANSVANRIARVAISGDTPGTGLRVAGGNPTGGGLFQIRNNRLIFSTGNYDTRATLRLELNNNYVVVTATTYVNVTTMLSLRVRGSDEGISGDGTQSSPYILRVPDLAPGAELLELRASGGLQDQFGRASYDLSVQGDVFALDNITPLRYDLNVNAMQGLFEGGTYQATVELNTDPASGNSYAVTVYFSAADIEVPPIVVSGLDAVRGGEGTEESPLVVPAGFTSSGGALNIIATLDFSGGFRHGGDLSVDAANFGGDTSSWQVLVGSGTRNFIGALAAIPENTRHNIVYMVSQMGQVTPVTLWLQSGMNVSASFVSPLPRNSDGHYLLGGPLHYSGGLFGKVVLTGGDPTNRTYDLSPVLDTVDKGFQVIGNVIAYDDISQFDGTRDVSNNEAFDVEIEVDSPGSPQFVFTVTAVAVSSTPRGYEVLVDSRTLGGVGTEDDPFMITNADDIQVGATLAQVAAGGGTATGDNFSYSTGSTQLGVGSADLDGFGTVTVSEKLVPGMSYQMLVTVVADSSLTTVITVHFEVADKLDGMLEFTVSPVSGAGVAVGDGGNPNCAGADFCALAPAKNRGEALLMLEATGVTTSVTFEVTAGEGNDALQIEINSVNRSADSAEAIVINSLSEFSSLSQRNHNLVFTARSQFQEVSQTIILGNALRF